MSTVSVPFSFAFQLTPGQWSRCTEDGMSTFCKSQQHIFRNMVPSALGTVFGRIPLFLTKSAFFKHSSLLSFLSQEMSLNIDIKRILPVKVYGDCPKELSRLLILSQSCNDVNPGKIFHSNSVNSPLTSSKSL